MGVLLGVGLLVVSCATTAEKQAQTWKDVPPFVIKGKYEIRSQGSRDTFFVRALRSRDWNWIGLGSELGDLSLVIEGPSSAGGRGGEPGFSVFHLRNRCVASTQMMIWAGIRVPLTDLEGFLWFPQLAASQRDILQPYGFRIEAHGPWGMRITHASSAVEIEFLLESSYPLSQEEVQVRREDFHRKTPFPKKQVPALEFDKAYLEALCHP